MKGYKQQCFTLIIMLANNTFDKKRLNQADFSECFPHQTSDKKRVLRLFTDW